MDVRRGGPRSTRATSPAFRDTHRRGRYLPVQPDGPDGPAGLHGDPFGLYRDLALGQRGSPQRLPRPRALRGRQRQPGAVLRAPRRRDPAPADEGDRPARAVPARGRGPGPAELRHSAKEQAENVMIVDLLRNDVARVAETGSVAVPALFTVERFETVLQLTSDVTARLRPQTGLVELFRALFPCGSDHRGAQGKLHGRHPLAGADAPAASTAARSVSSGRPTRPLRARFSVAIRTAVVDTEDRRRRLRHRRRHHVGLRARGRARRGRHQSGGSRPHVHEFELLETLRYDPNRGLRNRDRHLRRMAESAEHLGFRFDLSDAAGGAAFTDDGRRRGTGPVAAAAHRSRGRRRGAVPRRPAGPRPPRARRRPGRPVRAVALPQDHVPGALRASASAAARRRRRHHGQHTR